MAYINQYNDYPNIEISLYYFCHIYFVKWDNPESNLKSNSNYVNKCLLNFFIVKIYLEIFCFNITILSLEIVSLEMK